MTMDNAAIGQGKKYKKVLANLIFEKGLIPEIYKEFLQFNREQNKQTKTHRKLKRGQSPSTDRTAKKTYKRPTGICKDDNITHCPVNTNQDHNEVTTIPLTVFLML